MEHQHHHSTNDKPENLTGHHKHSSNAGHGSNPKHGETGHDHSAMIEDFKQRFYVSLGLTIPILVLSDMIQHWLGFENTCSWHSRRFCLGMVANLF
jgi:P-type Cu2+ transporter